MAKKPSKKNSRKAVAVETVSVANLCDYVRTNGKCGRAMCENFGKPCPGRSCDDWKCDAEGEEPKSVIEKANKWKWFCGELRCNGTCGNGKSENHNKKCRGENCPDLIQTKSTAVTVVEPKAGAMVMSDKDVAAGIKHQCQVIENAEKNAQLERVKLGVILIRWEQYLGESRGGRHDKGGLKGWLEENVPELGYTAANNYKQQAAKAVKMLGGGAKAQAVLLDEPTVTQPDGAVIEVDAEYVEKRDNLFNEVKSRRELEQTYFKFMASEGAGGGARRGRPKGSGAEQVEYKKKSAMECAVDEVWPTVQHFLKHRAAMFTAYKILPDEKLTEFRDTLNEHVKAIEAVLDARKK